MSKSIGKLLRGNYYSQENTLKNKAFNRIGCIADGGYQGYTLGWGDEIVGAGYATGKALDDVSELKNPFPSVSQNYQTARDLNRNHLNWCNDNYPISTALSEFIGAYYSPARIAALGRLEPIGLGTVAGLGTGEKDISSHLKSTVIGAASAGAANWGIQKLPQIKGVATLASNPHIPANARKLLKEIGEGIADSSLNNALSSFWQDGDSDYNY